MLHQARTYQKPESAQSPDELLEMLKDSLEQCDGGALDHAIRYANLLFVNDSTGNSGCFCEYAVFDKTRGGQIDSWTIDWLGKIDIHRSIKALANLPIHQEGLPVFE